MSKNVTLVTYPEGTFLKSYDTFVAFKAKDYMHLVTKKHHSKTTSRHISDFLGGSDVGKGAEKVSQNLLDTMGKFIEAHQ